MKKGFTLIELLVSVAVFSTIVAIVSGLFISSLQAQQRILATQQLLDQTSYLMEYITRSIRMAVKDGNPPDCLTTPNLNYEKTRSGTGIEFKNYHGQCQEFFRRQDGGIFRLIERKGLPGSEVENYLTSPDLEVVSFNIGPDDSWAQPNGICNPPLSDCNQPRVTLFLEIRGRGAEPEWRPVIKLQTTISQRNLDYQQ